MWLFLAGDRELPRAPVLVRVVVGRAVNAPGSDPFIDDLGKVRPAWKPNPFLL
jgi:hypothetical protein